MNYFLDLEFLEGPQKKLFGYTKPTIDLISIGIKCEDGREYYAISKDFNLKEAWNRCDVTRAGFTNSGMTPAYEKVYWIRENVLKSIYLELEEKELYEGSNSEYKSCFDNDLIKEILLYGWNRDSFIEKFQKLKKLINKYGKTNKQIADDIKIFCLPSRGFIRDWYETKHGNLDTSWDFSNLNNYETGFNAEYDNYQKPEFYGYYSDYDWVCFCWLFGKMIDLPKGFPMYCIDLKQTLDERIKTYTSEKLSKETFPNCGHNVYEAMDYKKPLITMERCIKDHPNYPKQTNEHNALADAKWNFELYKFLNTL